MDFQRYADHADAFVQEVAAAMGLADAERAQRTLRAVLHGLRAGLSLGASRRLLSQLPLMIKAIYIDGWDFDRADGGASAELLAFLDGPEGRGGEGSRSAVGAVFHVLKRHASAGELEPVVRELPAPLAELWRAS